MRAEGVARCGPASFDWLALRDIEEGGTGVGEACEEGMVLHQAKETQRGWGSRLHQSHESLVMLTRYADSGEVSQHMGDGREAGLGEKLIDARRLFEVESNWLPG